jgi:prepilin-type N-terminal cleavage/methylation domain-containing protein
MKGDARTIARADYFLFMGSVHGFADSPGKVPTALGRTDKLGKVGGPSIRSLRRKTFMTSKRNRGFSLLEMMISVAIIIILSSFAFIWMTPISGRQHLDDAYDTTLSTLRTTRNLAIAQSYEYLAVFNAATGTIQVEWQPPMSGGVCPAIQAVNSYKIPSDITYAVRGSFPNTQATVPDGFGIGAVAVDFGYLPTGAGGGGTTLAFMPDGSIRDTAGGCNGLGDYNSGVIYMTRAADPIYSSRAITVWGTTGRIRGWTLTQVGAGAEWMQQ